MRKSSRKRFFTNISKDGDIDEFTFKIWKSELERELPQFWESINESKKNDVFVDFTLGNHN
jgi:hypothetical protein